MIAIVFFSPLVFWLRTWDLNTCLKCHSGDHSKESNSYESVTLQFEWFSVFILSSNLLSQIHLCDRLTLLKSQETQDRSKGERKCQEQETQRQAD